ncbi:uroporphyrinogen-III C-methyltransferase [Variovorax dokdonensis]|uniref:Uroporphyrinogen-III C-methyltransferase n=1 Tax=Variovorax dokdonensis TaxID=344883 RepID=A0ABT7N6I3_9BURK|nr:uroporphyrinogen-III C-methyltransferase [Variovorax dokdonensis]MDM0043536.1 uroporphyrinogen-III C-methyltransferase [Variovorax dokdonensis]
MSEAPLTNDAVAMPVNRAVPSPVAVPAVENGGGLTRIVLAVVAVVAFVALLMAFLLWQNVNGMREQLARQSADALAQAGEARTLARQASEVVRDAAGKIALNESRIAELALQRAQLEEVMQTLSRSRDESMVVEIDSAVRLGLQQAQATGNIEPLLVALKFGEQRVARSVQPRLAPLQRAMARDLDQLQSTAGGGIADSLHKLDDLMRLVDELPAANAVAAPGGGSLLAAEPLPADAPWWQEIWAAVLQEARSLVRVGRVDRPEAVLVSQDQIFFLRENLKLKLLTVRLSLLSRQMSNARAELASVTASLNRYFDPRSRRTQSAATLIQQLQAQIKEAPALNIDNTLAALTAAAAGR